MQHRMQEEHNTGNPVEDHIAALTEHAKELIDI